MKILSIFFIIFMSISLFAKDNFKSIHIVELEKLLQEKSHPIYLYDVNVDSTRTNVGIIPGAKLINPSSNFDLKNTLPTNLDAPLVFYCANTRCTASHLAAENAIALGFKNVSVMVDGIYGWQKAGKKLEAIRGPSSSTEASEVTPKQAYEEVLRKKAIIVDVRELEERHEIIAGSLSAPTSKLENPNDWRNFISKLPKNKKIILHCAAGFRSKKIAEKLSSEGIIAEYFKGPDQWKDAGLPLSKNNTFK